MNADFDIADAGLADKGRRRIEWANSRMPVLQSIRERYRTQRPLKGVSISGCLHITSETANLARTLSSLGADLALCASNPLSTQDDVAAALVVNEEIPVFATRGESDEMYYQHLNAVLDRKPALTIDDGADLVSTLHKTRKDLLKDVIGGTEETTTGIVRLKAMAKDGMLAYPIIDVNGAITKHQFDNRYGTGQSTLDGIIRATNILLAGKTMVVAGYGWCGRGISMRAKGMGAHVIVTEVDPVKALEALMDGFQVMPMMDAAKIGDIFVTATGDISVLDRPHFDVMKDGAILANSGHFKSEVNVEVLTKIAKEVRRILSHVEEFIMSDGRRLLLIAEGRLVNLGAADGHPAEVMDMSFANQALSLLYLATEAQNFGPGVYPVPAVISEQIAELKLGAFGVKIDKLTKAQKKYLSQWSDGT